MHTPAALLANNRAWAARITAEKPDFFRRLSAQQTPDYLWIGCSDSRVPANQIVGLLPGELFVHRNVGNLIVDTDLNCLAVMQLAVDVLEVEHIVVCGHYRCTAVTAAWRNTRLGLIDNWLRHVQDVRERHEALLARLSDPAARVARLCELNVIEQVRHVCETTVMQEAWARGQQVAVHGWIYGLTDGRLRDLGASVTGTEALGLAYGGALARLDAEGAPGA